jgi:hypothetical protein
MVRSMIVPVDAIVDPERGRAAYAKGAWSEASSRCPVRIGPRRSTRGISSSWRAPRACSGETMTTSGGLERAHRAHFEAQWGGARCPVRVLDRP